MGPKGVTVDHNGHVIVVDNKSCTVFIFQPTGKLISKFGSRGNGDKQFAGIISRFLTNVTSGRLWLYFNAVEDTGCTGKLPVQPVEYWFLCVFL